VERTEEGKEEKREKGKIAVISPFLCLRLPLERRSPPCRTREEEGKGKKEGKGGGEKGNTSFISLDLMRKRSDTPSKDRLKKKGGGRKKKKKNYKFTLARIHDPTSAS